MKTNLQLVLIICLVISTLVFGILWYAEKNNNDDLLLLAKSGASDAYTQFSEYQTIGYDGSYWSGVSSFKVFETVYHFLAKDENDNHVYCNEVYGELVLHPDKCKEHITDIVEAMNILLKNINDENGHFKIYELRNALTHK